MPEQTLVELEARFEKFVERRGEDECWPWHGSTIKGGRGVLSFQGKCHIAPRVSWALANGRMPDQDKMVCHSCDNPNCVNPAHLWLGTNSDNIKDAANKGRLGMQKNPMNSFFAKPESNKFRPRGSRHGSAVLDEDRVRFIKAELARGVEQKALAARFGVTPMTIWRISAGRNWSHVR